MGWWDEFNDVPGGNALRYYLGPAYAPINALAQFGVESLPGADMVEMHRASDDLMHGRGSALENLGWLGAATLGMFVPGNAGMLRDELAGMKLYHGTPNPDIASGRLPLTANNIGERRTDYGNFGDAVYATPKRFLADAYAKKGGQKGGVRELTAPLRNPLFGRVTGPEYTEEVESIAKELGVTAAPEWRGSGQHNPAFAREFREKAMAAGYDGVVTLDIDGNIGAEVAIFDEGLIGK